MSTFQFDLLSPERLVYSSSIRSMVVPGKEGEMTILPSHAPVLSSLKSGVLSIETEDSVIRFFVSSGFIDITASSVMILAEDAVEISPSSQDRLKTSLESARLSLEKTPEGEEKEEARALVDCLERLS